MKKVGIIGGMGPESTVDYYKSIITNYQQKIGNKQVLPEIFINSIDMYKMFDFLEAGDQESLVHFLAENIEKLKRMGADFAVLSANTPHIVFDELQQHVSLPMVSLVEETCAKTKSSGIKRVGLIGTSFTMKSGFFQEAFEAEGMTIVVPDEENQAYIHRKIVEELEHGIVNQSTKEAFLAIIQRMVNEEHIQGVILGCTELPMLIKDQDLDIMPFNTTAIHVDKIVQTMLSNER